MAFWGTQLKKLGVKEVDVARAPLHDQLDYRFYPGREMRGPGLHVEGVPARYRFGRSSLAPPQILGEQIGQGGAVGPGPDAAEKAATTQR